MNKKDLSEIIEQGIITIKTYSDQDSSDDQQIVPQIVPFEISSNRHPKSKNIAIFIVFIIAVTIFILFSIFKTPQTQGQIILQTPQHTTNQSPEVTTITKSTDIPTTKTQVTTIDKPAQNSKIPKSQPPISPKIANIEPTKNEDQFNFQNKFWLFDTSSQKSTLERLYFENNQYFAKKSGFEINILNFTTAQKFLSPTIYTKLKKIKEELTEKVPNGGLSNQQYDRIIKKVTLLFIIAENGGVMISEPYCLTETFDWLRTIKSEIHARRGTNNVKAEVFGFYDPATSSPCQKENIQTEFQAQKYMRIFPGLQSYFLVAKKGARFITELIDEIILILTNPGTVNQDGAYSFYNVNAQNHYEEYFKLATHRLLQRMQKTLNQKNTQNKYKTLALDYYGLYTINDLSAGQKIFTFFDGNNEGTALEYLTKWTMEEWQEMAGRTYQVTKLTSPQKMNALVEDIIAGRRDPMIKGSFLQRILFPTVQAVNYIIDSPEKSFIDEKSQPWIGLPKKIWVYWNNDIGNAPLSAQLCIKALKKRGKESGFQVNVVTENTLQKFLSDSMIKKIKRTFQTAQLQTFPQTLPDLIRLALLIEHGGIYLDSSFLPVTNFDWIVNIGRYPSKYITNRYGNLPKVIMQYHPWFGGVFDFKFNKKYNTKVQWRLPYENNFIATEKDNEFIKEWFQFLVTVYSQPYPSFQNAMRDMQMFSWAWSTTYLIPMDALKYVLARKQKELSNNPSSQWADAADYYKIWALNGHYSFQKYRAHYGLQTFNQEDNSMIYRYSNEYVETFIGRNYNLVKFYGPLNVPLSQFIQNNINDKFTKEAHPKSLFMTYMYNQDIEFYYENRWKVRQ